MQEPELTVDYAPRPQFVAFHQRRERFACIVTHRRAGKTVACVQDLQRAAIECRKVRRRFAYLAPFLKRLADSIRISRRAVPLESPIVVGTVDEPPALLTHPPIRYAPEMQSLRIGGTVIVEATLDTTGRVVPASVKVVQTPNPVFDAESRRVVQAAVYRPARVHGRPARVTIRQAITFAAY